MVPEYSTRQSWSQSLSDVFNGLRQAVKPKDILLSGFIHFSVGMIYIVFNVHLLNDKKLATAQQTVVEGAADHGHRLTATFLPGLYFTLTSFVSCFVLSRRRRLMAVIYSFACILSATLSMLIFLQGTSAMTTATYKVSLKPLDDVLIMVLALVEFSTSFIGLMLSCLFAMQEVRSNTRNGFLPSWTGNSGIHPHQRLVSIEITGPSINTSLPSYRTSTSSYLVTATSTCGPQQLTETDVQDSRHLEGFEGRYRIHRYRRRRLQRHRGVVSSSQHQNALFSDTPSPPNPREGTSIELPPSYEQSNPGAATEGI